MKLFALTRKAQDDLRNIALYTEDQWGVAQRNIYIKKFDDTFHTLGKTRPSEKSAMKSCRATGNFPKGATSFSTSRAQPL
jgi:toxin ParE1/3/4